MRRQDSSEYGEELAATNFWFFLLLELADEQGSKGGRLNFFI
jgi:hypothetical protein